MGNPPASEIQSLLTALDQAFDHPAWHGQNLRGAVRRLKAVEAAWRPGVGRNNIWELVVHCAYWKYTVTRRILGLKKGSFPLPGSNFFPRPVELSEKAWKVDLQLLDACHARLREAIEGLDPARLDQKLTKWTVRDTIVGAALHDTYHGGQIQLIKRLYAQAQEEGARL